MKPWISLTQLGLGLAALALVSGHSAEGRRRGANAAETPSVGGAPAAGAGFEAFRLLTERNIFNPNRTGRTRAPAEEARPPRTEVLSLVGTLESEQGALAFFDSSDPSLRKAVREGDRLGEFTVKRIGRDQLELQGTSGPQVIRVTQQLRRVEGGNWVLAAGAGEIAAPVSEPETSAPAAPSAGASEVLQRLMKQREKQLK